MRPVEPLQPPLSVPSVTLPDNSMRWGNVSGLSPIVYACLSLSCWYYSRCFSCVLDSDSAIDLPNCRSRWRSEENSSEKMETESSESEEA